MLKPITMTSKSCDIDMKSSRDAKDCGITGLAILPNNRILAVDFWNNAVKLADSYNNKLIAELNLLSSPWDVAVITVHLSAVTLPHEEKILFIKVNDTLTQEREINVDGECRGVAFSHGRLFITYVGNPRLEIVDMFGQIIRRIKFDRDGTKLFKSPRYVCVSSDAETIYVSDLTHGAVFSLSLDGVVKCVNMDKELRGLQKVCSDQIGNIYVCGYGSRNVLKIARGSNNLVVIFTRADGLDRDVYSVSHCQDTGRLFVGMGDRIVKAYKL